MGGVAGGVAGRVEGGVFVGVSGGETAKARRDARAWLGVLAPMAPLHVDERSIGGVLLRAAAEEERRSSGVALAMLCRRAIAVGTGTKPGTGEAVAVRRSSADAVGAMSNAEGSDAWLSTPKTASKGSLCSS